jgi:hypothetical protein
MGLCNDLKLKDMKAFNFHDFLEFDLILYFRYGVLGGRRYLLGEKDENLPNARRRFLRMRLLDRTLKTLVWGSLFYYIVMKQNFMFLPSLFCSLSGFSRC